MVKRLIVIEGNDLGRAFPLPESGSLLLGTSDRSTDVTLRDPFVSKLHCTVVLAADRVIVADLKNSKGTFVNDKQVSRQELRPGDVLRIGNTLLRLEVEGGAPPSAVPPPEEEPGDAAHTPVNRLEELAGKTLGHYKLLNVLGKGHVGVTFRATDLKANQAVALKIFGPQFPDSPEEQQRFIRALKKALAARHPHLVSVLGSAKAGLYCWIVQEYVPGESVAQVIRRLSGTGKFDWRYAYQVVHQVGQALQYAHRQHIRHSNITPANILWQSGTHLAKLNDLMLSEALAGSLLQRTTLEQKFLAELPYMAPEMTEDGAFIDEMSDLYSLGCVAYELLTGRPPYQGRAPEETIDLIRAGVPVRPTQHSRQIPVEFESVVLKLLARRQEDRYSSAGELLNDLANIAAKESATA
jgi:serine/threonine protein kinase